MTKKQWWIAGAAMIVVAGVIVAVVATRSEEAHSASSCPPPQTCPPEKNCPPPPACPVVSCPVCETCPTCEVCPPPLGYDATGSLTYYVVGPGRAGTVAYVALTAYHRQGAWDFDMINSTGGVKTEAELRHILATPEKLLDEALQAAKNNHGQGSATVNGSNYDFGSSSAGTSIYGRGDDGYLSLVTLAVDLVK